MGERRYEIKGELGMVQYRLRFTNITHSKHLYSIGKEMNLFLIKSAIRCSLDYSDGGYLGLGFSYCFHSDKFDQRKGERIALKRALETHNDKLQREARRFIWTEYFKLRPIKPEPTQRELRKTKARKAMEKIPPGEGLARRIARSVKLHGEEATRKALKEMINQARPDYLDLTTKENQ